MARQRSIKRKREQEQWIGAGQAERPICVSNGEVDEEFKEASHRAPEPLNPVDRLRRYRSQFASSSQQDPKAAWDSIESGEDMVSYDVAEPDQDFVEQFGQAVGLPYDENEPLHTTEKLERRDRQRWELDPASSEDYIDRVNERQPLRNKESKRILGRKRHK
jgi:hypothetical protein